MSQPFRTPILTASLGPWGLVGMRLGDPQEGVDMGAVRRAERTRCWIYYHLWQPKRIEPPCLPSPRAPLPLPPSQPACWEEGSLCERSMLHKEPLCSGEGWV